MVFTRTQLGCFPNIEKCIEISPVTWLLLFAFQTTAQVADIGQRLSKIHWIWMFGELRRVGNAGVQASLISPYFTICHGPVSLASLGLCPNLRLEVATGPSHSDWEFGNINMHCMQLYDIIRILHLMHFACLCVCVCVCVCSIYATVVYCYVLYLFGNWKGQSKVKKLMQCIAMQLKFNAIRNAKQCAYVDRCVRTYVSNPISKPSNIINILRIYWVGSPPDKSDKELEHGIAWILHDLPAKLWVPNFLICRVALDLIQTAGQLGLGSRHLSRSNDKMCVEIICLVYLDLIHLWMLL